jgi:hypothetical protein
MNRAEAQFHRQELERILPSYPLAFSPLRDRAVEQAQFPSMVEIYWSLVDATEHPPLQDQFATAVLERLAAEGLARHFPREAVLARAGRTYASLVRQHHFEYVLRSRFPWVYRGHQLDLAGLDFLILEGGRGYGVGLSVETTQGRLWHEVKDKRHAELPVPVLDLYAEPGQYMVGRFWLHPPSDVEQVAGFIASEEARSREQARLVEDAQHALDEVYRTSERRPRCSRSDFAAGFFGALAYVRETFRSRA